MYIINTMNTEETMQFGEKLGSLLFEQAVLTLEGDLGAGKTTLTKGIAKGLGVTRNVNSPTFTIMKEYYGRMPLYHMDVYRMDDSSEDLGFDEYFYGEGVTIVEWAQRIQEQLPTERLDIVITRVTDTHRQIILKPLGQEYETLCEEICP